jgi:PAS domain S-box-containing protein
METGTKNRSSSEYLSNIIDSSPVALISLDTRLRILMFNSAARHLTGFTGSEVTGRRISMIIEPARAKIIIQAMRTGESGPIEGYLTRFKTKNGEGIQVRLKITPITGADRKFIGAVLLATDLSEIKELQSKLLEAERLEAITETAVGVNHEINNPLCSILGYTQLILMEKDRLDPDVVMKLRSIEEQIIRIQEIAERLGRINKPVLKEYVGGKKMVDFEQSCTDDSDTDQ